MAFLNFTPTVWAARLLKNLNDQHVYALGFNRDYEGDIRGAGDTVKITSIGTVTVKNYTRNADIDAPEEIHDAAQFLTPDQEKYFHFAVDDVDEAQAKPGVMDNIMSEAAFQIADTIDNYLATQLKSGAGIVLSSVQVGTDTAAADTGLYETLVDINTKMNEQNIPSDGRYAVIPPWAEGLLRKDDRFVSFGTPANVATLRGAPIGRVNNLLIRMSNNVPNDATTWDILSSHRVAATFAEQVTKMEAYRPDRRFADAMKGLHVYGAKVTRPYAVVHQPVTKGTGAV